MRFVLIFIFQFILFDSYSQIENRIESFKKWYNNHFAQSVDFRTLNYKHDCLYKKDSNTYNGYAFRNYSDKSLVFCSVNQGKIDSLVKFDSLMNIIQISFDTLLNLEVYEEYFVSRSIKLYGIMKKDQCDSLFGIIGVFGTAWPFLKMKEYFPNGNLSKDLNYDFKGRITGKAVSYYENGKKYKVAFLEEGKGVGKWKQYNQLGIRVGFVKFKNKEIIQAKWYEYDSEKKCYFKTIVRKGRRTTSEDCSAKKLNNGNDEWF